MRVLALTPEAFGGLGGISEYHRGLLRALCRIDSCEEVVALARRGKQSDEPLPEKLKYIWASTGGKLRFVFETIKQLMDSSAFDVVVCGHYNLLPVAWWAAWRSNARLVLFVHGIEVWRPQARPLSRLSTPGVDVIVSVSELTEKRFSDWAFRKKTKPKSVVIPCTIDTKRFTPGPKDNELVEKYNLEGKTVLLTLARLNPLERYKGIDEILQVLPKLCAENDTLRYLVAGSGEDQARLAAKAEALGVSDRVEFLGHVDESRKVALYRTADAFLMPGRGEGFGIVYLEALACGVPALGSVLDGSSEALRDGMLGVLVNPDQEEDIVRGIKEVLASPRGTVPEGISYFSTELFDSRIESLIKETLIE